MPLARSRGIYYRPIHKSRQGVKLSLFSTRKSIFYVKFFHTRERGCRGSVASLVVMGRGRERIKQHDLWYPLFMENKRVIRVTPFCEYPHNRLLFSTYTEDIKFEPLNKNFPKKYQTWQLEYRKIKTYFSITTK